MRRNAELLRPRPFLIGVNLVAPVAAIVASPNDAQAAAVQTWPPFVLVAGLLMIGVVAHADGRFAGLGAGAARVRAHPAVLLIALLGVVAAVTTVLKLETSVAFLTPVLVLAARARGLDEEPFLYGTLLMSNAASLLLHGSNLTNLLVLGREHVPGALSRRACCPPGSPRCLSPSCSSSRAYRQRLGASQPTPVDRVAARVRIISRSSAAVVLPVVAVLAQAERVGDEAEDDLGGHDDDVEGQDRLQPALPAGPADRRERAVVVAVAAHGAIIRPTTATPLNATWAAMLAPSRPVLEVGGAEDRRRTDDRPPCSEAPGSSPQHQTPVE